MIKPLSNRVLIKPLIDQAKQLGVLGVDTKEKDRPMVGEIVSVSDDYTGVPKKGDTVYFQRYESEEITHDKKTFYIVGKEFLFALVK